jgi:hypothetical protein
MTCVAVLLLYVRSWAAPVVFADDFPILAQSRTWERTRAGLWLPQNEHAMPLGRLFSFALECLAGRLPALPFVLSWVGPLALLAGLGLVYLFVRRELGHPFYGLLAVVLFGVTTVYHQAIWWFAASFAVLSLDTMLLGLLAAQRWRQTGRAVYLDLTVLACLLAPGWFAIGVLAGPLCFLYLLPRSRESGSDRSTRHWSIAPLLGTALFLVLSLPRTAEAILHLKHYDGRTAVEAFQPLVGLKYTLRSVVDNLLLGVIGIAGVALSLWCVVPVLVGLLAVGVWWWRQAPERRLLLLGLGLIGGSYLLVYSARAAWSYARMTEPAFSRYHLLSQLGLVLFFCGGLPGRAGRWFTLHAEDVLTVGQRRLIHGLILGCFVVNLPRGLICGSPTGWEFFSGVHKQLAVLRRIEAMDARCRTHHIAAAEARQVLGRLDVPWSLDALDGWELLIGSDDPRPLPAEEVKRFLDAPGTD